MSKKLNITGITNELEGSAFFPSRKPAPTPLPTPTPPLPDHQPEQQVSNKIQQPAPQNQTPNPSDSTTRTPSTRRSPSTNSIPRPSSPPSTISSPSTTRTPSTLTSSGRRKIKQRHPFDIYLDQLETLKKLALEERMQGGVGSMSAMVREALDKFIEEKIQGKK